MNSRLLEASAIVRQGWLMAKHAVRSEVDAGQGTHAVVFVHGFLAAGAVFEPMMTRVNRETGWSCVSFTYSPLASFYSVAHELRAFIDRRLPSRARVSLVGHSLGGLLARWYVQRLGGAARVDRLVTLATPHSGTYAAGVGALSLTRAMAPGSAVLRALGPSASEHGPLPHVAIIAGRDRMITPPESAGRVEDARIVCLDDVSHNQILFDARAQRVVVSALQ